MRVQGAGADAGCGATAMGVTGRCCRWARWRRRARPGARRRPGIGSRFRAITRAIPDFKLEWWYYTGNLETSSGRRFGYQVTFFRVGVDPAPVNPSAWAVRDLFMAHLAVSDPEGGRYRYDEKLTRAGPGLSGAETDRYRVWNEEWRAGLDDQGRHTIHAVGRNLGVELRLDEGKPPAINGIGGISQKGAQAGNASHYYSLTRMPTRGSLIVDGERFEVAGRELDGPRVRHELPRARAAGLGLAVAAARRWPGADALPAATRRWLARSALQRHAGGSGGPDDAPRRERVHDGGGPDGDLRSASGRHLPVEWTVTFPGPGSCLGVSTPLTNQELVTPAAGIAYWEGLVDVTGTSRGAPIDGRGYLEMTGYKGSLGRVMTQ